MRCGIIIKRNGEFGKMKHILVTGSEGYIGTIMVKKLLENNFQVTGLDSCFFENGNLDNSTKLNYKLIKKDIRDIKLEDLLNQNYYAIIHLAALSNDPLGMINEQLTYDINYKASVDLAKLAKEANIKRFLFSSSCSLYGDGKGNILDETSESNPQTAYGKSKILAENEISKLADEKFSPTFMRNATAFGFSPRMRFDIVVNSLTGFAKVENEIKILGDGKPWRPLVHVDDICKAFLFALNEKKENIHNQAFNVGSDKENYQIKEIANHIKNFSGCNISIAKTEANDTRDYNVSFKKIQTQLNFDIDFSLDKGISSLLEEYQKIQLKDDFYHRYYTRLSQIKHLLDNKKIDKELRWIKN
jgi:nucleoside-diphosphate-sugar epimerase